MRGLFNPEEIEFIRINAYGALTKELTDRFNAHFNRNMKVSQIYSFKNNHKIVSCVVTRFQPGKASYHPPKGLRISPETEFKKGHVPQNHKPVGTERINRDGYHEIKIAEPKKWKAKHVLLWESINGSVPRGHKILFLDDDKGNLTIENLAQVSSSELLVMNRNSLVKKDANLTKTGIIIAKVIQKTNAANKK